MEWIQIIKSFMTSNEEMKRLKEKIVKLRETKKIYPATGDVYNAFGLCPYDSVRVVILGQDAYHTPGTAHGLMKK